MNKRLTELKGRTYMAANLFNQDVRFRYTIKSFILPHILLLLDSILWVSIFLLNSTNRNYCDK